MSICIKIVVYCEWLIPFLLYVCVIMYMRMHKITKRFHRFLKKRFFLIQFTRKISSRKTLFTPSLNPYYCCYFSFIPYAIMPQNNVTFLCLALLCINLISNNLSTNKALNGNDGWEHAAADDYYALILKCIFQRLKLKKRQKFQRKLLSHSLKCAFDGIWGDKKRQTTHKSPSTSECVYEFSSFYLLFSKKIIILAVYITRRSACKISTIEFVEKGSVENNEWSQLYR